jgi:Zn-dependent protease
MGHAQCARQFGHSPRILLYGFGGLAIYHPIRDEPAWQKAAVLICGPLAGFVIAAALIALQTSTGMFSTGYLRFLYVQLLWINIGWGLLNLLPVWPLDGGQLAYTLVDGFTPFQAARVIRILSVTTAALMSLFAFTSQQTYLALFFAYFAAINWQRWR